MILFGVQMPVWAIIVGCLLIVAVIALIVISVISEKNKEVADVDTREKFGDFHGLLSQEDFDIRSDDPNLEMYRKQWISAKPGDEKDNYLLLYLALKQLNKEQDESENEWSQEECEKRMDEILSELSEKTGLKLIENQCDEFADYFDTLPEDDEDTELGEDDIDDEIAEEDSTVIQEDTNENQA